MLIRIEKKEDINEIRQLNIKAFGQNAESNLIDSLRKAGVPLISLVAKSHGTLIGHILFSPVDLKPQGKELKIAGLAPMAVLPDHQNKGIGSKLVSVGLEHCKQMGYDAVIVLGHPDYYPRFGFTSSVKFGIKSTYEVPDNVFMIKELKEGVLSNCHGVIHYHKCFGQLD